jgi:hypothetical protein
MTHFPAQASDKTLAAARASLPISYNVNQQ